MVGDQASGFWLVEAAKTGTETSLLCLNSRSSPLKWLWYCSACRCEGAFPLGFFLFARLSLGIWNFSRASDYCVLCNYVIMVPVNTASLETDLCRV